MAGQGHLRGRIHAVGGLLAAFNLLAWLWAIFAFRHHPLLLSEALLAYSFGLRHAVDADHIAAIDNVTRKLMQNGQRPVTVGLYFSFGHSTIVFLLSLLVAATTTALETRFADLRAAGGVIGTSLSAFFLFAIAAANLLLLADIWRSFRSVRRGEAVDKDALDLLTSGGGVMARLLRRLFGLIGRSRHMFVLGLLFGLGFDTATEVGLLGISALGASNGLSPWSILVFPTLFSAGMALIDTADGILMLGAYGWAFVKPLRKPYYNLTVTALSVLVAVMVGAVEVLGLIESQLKLAGPFWSLIASVNDNLGLMGYGIVALFACGWLASLAIYKLGRLDEVEAA